MRNLAEAVEKVAKKRHPDFDSQADYIQMASDFDKASKDLQKWQEEKREYEKTRLYRQQEKDWKQGMPVPTAPGVLRDQIRAEPAQPIPARRKVNLPPLTKAMLVMGSFNSDAPEHNILTQNGYRYADILRHTATMCRGTLYYWGHLLD